MTQRILKTPIIETHDKGTLVSTKISSDITESPSKWKVALTALLIAASAGLTACGQSYDTDYVQAPTQEEMQVAQSIQESQSIALFSKEDCLTNLEQVRQSSPEAGCQELKEVDGKQYNLGSIDTPAENQGRSSIASTNATSHSSSSSPWLWYMIGHNMGSSSQNNYSSYGANPGTSSFASSGFTARPSGYLNLDGKGNTSVSKTPSFSMQSPVQASAIHKAGGIGSAVQSVKSGVASNVSSGRSSFSSARASVGHASSGHSASHGGFGHSSGHSSGG